MNCAEPHAPLYISLLWLCSVCSQGIFRFLHAEGMTVQQCCIHCVWVWLTLLSMDPIPAGERWGCGGSTTWHRVHWRDRQAHKEVRERFYHPRRLWWVISALAGVLFIHGTTVLTLCLLTALTLSSMLPCKPIWCCHLRWPDLDRERGYLEVCIHEVKAKVRTNGG